ncbi:hypothetical protein RclHR1_02760013 [Rhizophagus clarus]|uniref:RNA polymerase II-associated protein 1 n=1 Tax=Rhizophagus clarus TaxID=94130 RepID=A0A2Z6R2U7_9GLOM|nr:hypothetical protein RclHR1_02760013 [Rhizophagus clarus]GES91894.1 RNA polymerase II-associated protein 1 [Rhizophagus clarus]
MSRTRDNVRIRDNVETEEELLKLQEEFLTTKQRAAATVIRKSNPPNVISISSQVENNVNVIENNVNFVGETQKDIVTLNDNVITSSKSIKGQIKNKKKKSLFSSNRKKSLGSNGGAHRFEIDLDQEMKNTAEQEEHVPAIKKVLDMHSYQTGTVGMVTEKFTKEPVLPPKINTDNNTSSDGGFPKAVHRSLFKRRKQALDEVSKSSVDNQQINNENTAENIKNLPTTSAVSSSSLNTLNKDTKIYNSDHLEIDRENAQKISNMSEEEILQTIEMLRQTLSPKFLEKLSKSQSLVERISEESNEEFKGTEEKEIKHVHFQEEKTLSVNFDDDDDDDSLPLKMKEKYFPNVPIEPEKIEWMGVGIKKDESITNKDQGIVKDYSSPYVPKPTDPPAAFYRFDFHGNIMEKDADVPIYLGLHHHGDNPDQAGYTANELLHLTRSRVSSQRIIPLNVIGRIMRKVRKGHYGIEKCKGIAEWMIKMRLPIYLRTALDDTAESVIVAAVDAISALIIGGSEGLDIEEEIWDRSGRLYRGYEGVALQNDPETKVSKHFGMDIALQNENEEDADTTEYHVRLASRDLIAGLISMDILHRFRYLLEKMRLPYNTSEQIILMLIRFTRHSRKSAKFIFECPRLVDVIHKKFLCVAWPVIYNNSDDALSTFPSLPAVKLFRLLCQSSRKISQNIIQNYIETFLRYIVVNPSTISNEFGMNLGYKILQETLRIYQTLAAHGLYHEILSQAYSAFGGYLSKEIIYSLSPPWQWEGDNIPQMRYKLDIAISFFRLLEIWIRTSKKDTGTNVESGAHPSEFINDSVELLDKFVSSFPHEIDNKTENSREFEKALILISSVARYISSWYQYLGGYPLKDTSQIKNIWERLKFDSWQSSKIGVYLSYRLPACLNAYKISKKNFWQLSNLPGAYFPSTFEHVSKSITTSVLYDLYLSYISLIHQISNLFSADKEFSINSLNIIVTFVPIDLIQHHITKFPPGRNWLDFFDRTRTYLLYEWMGAISSLINNIGADDKSQYSKKLLQAALILMSHLLPGDEKISLDILNRIFDGITVSSSDPKRAEEIKKSLGSFYKNHITTSNIKEEIYSFSGQPEEDPTLLWNLMTNNSHGGLPLSRAWIWTPIDILYSKRSDVMMDEEVRFEVVRDCLAFGWEVMETCRDVARSSDYNIERFVMNPAIVVLSIMKIFLLEGELYRNSDIEMWIDKILSRYTFGFRSEKSEKEQDYAIVDSQKDYYSLEDAAKDVWTKPFYTFFTDFPATYAAESFGNKSFAQCLVVPLSTIYPFDFKLLVWGELFEVLSTINIKYEEVLCLNPSFNEGLKSYFWPLENNKTLIQSFVNSIIHNKLTSEKTPFLYWIVIHHLNGIVFWNIQERENQNEIKKDQMRIDIAKAIIKGAKSDIVKDWIRYTEKNFGDDVKELTKMPQCFEEIDDSKLKNRLEWLNTVNIDVDEKLIYSNC